MHEANLSSAESVIIDSPEGFLYEWWSLFWDIYNARNNKPSTNDARIYTEVSSPISAMIITLILLCFIQLQRQKGQINYPMAMPMHATHLPHGANIVHSKAGPPHASSGNMQNMTNMAMGGEFATPKIMDHIFISIFVFIVLFGVGWWCALVGKWGTR